MASTGVNNPHINIKRIIKKKDVNKACCWVSTAVEINMPIPYGTKRNTDKNNSSKPKLPTIGILKNSFPNANPAQNIKWPIIQNGINLPMINSCFFIVGQKIIYLILPIDLNKNMLFLFDCIVVSI